MCETPPERPYISLVFMASMFNPRNIVLNTLNKSPCDTISMFSSSLPMISSKNGFSLFHTSLRLSASENSLSSTVFSCISRFSRSHWIDLPQHLPRFLSRNSVLNIGDKFKCFPMLSAVCFARNKSDAYRTSLCPTSSFFSFSPILFASLTPCSDNAQSVQEPTMPFV